MKNIDTSYLDENEKNAIFSLTITHDENRTQKCTADININGNAFLVHEMIIAFFNDRPDVLEIFKDAISDMNEELKL